VVPDTVASTVAEHLDSTSGVSAEVEVLRASSSDALRMTAQNLNGYRVKFLSYRNMPGRAPSVEPAVFPSDEKKPLGLEAFARTLRSCDGMPRVRPRRFESTP
jgi:hypothetical protein